MKTRTLPAFRTVVGAALLGIAALSLPGCESTTSGGVASANRKQLMLVSSEDLNQVAAQSYQKLKSEASSGGALNQDQALLRRVQAIASRLEPQTGVFRPDAPGW